ncbi:hypothetical protein C2G38_2080833, partial [Gigaspora rosea]
MQIHNNGFTFVFTINYNNNNYSINYIDDKKLPNKYGGIVKLFSKKDKDSQNADEHLLILLALSGIYKYHMKNKSINNVQKLKYPKRIYNAIKNNLNLPFEILGITDIYNFIYLYIKVSLLNKHYFLVDTTKEDFKYIELYDLKTNQLVNTFRRPIYYKSNMIEFPNFYAISNNGKLLAYEYEPNKVIKIYSIECSLEIAELLITDLEFNIRFMHFFHNDEMLFIWSSKNKWSIWNIFGSLRDSIKFEDPGFEIELLSDFESYWETEQSNLFIVVNKNDKLTIYDDLVVDKYLKHLKKSDKQGWKKLSEDYFSKQGLNKNIQDLHDNESELDEDNCMLEPWLLKGDLKAPQYSFYLDEKKEKILSIGYHTIQVWYNQGTINGAKKRILELIYAPAYPLSFFQLSDLSLLAEWETKTIKAKNIKYCAGKFKLSIQIEDSDFHQIKIEDKVDVINLAKYACYALKYLSAYKKLEQLYDEDTKQNLYNVIDQTRNIILRFIRMYPTEWRLLDFRFGLLSILIEVGDYELVNDILLFGEPIHIPQYSPWPGGINTIRTALSDHTMLACLLEYYSNKAIHNIGWMNTVVDIIPELYKSNEEKNEKESYSYYYAQKLFYNPCFCNKQLDLLSFEFLEIIPKSNDLLKVFIPITQLIPQESKLDLQDIDYNKIFDIRMVPLADFTNKRISYIQERKPTNFLKMLISPGQYSALEEKDYSPFTKLVIKGERDILYENPSMGAVINWMWYSSKFYWPRTLYIFALYFLAYSIISWAYIAHIEITGALQHILIIITIVLFYYLSYYHIVVEFKQFRRKRKQYYLDLFNLVDLLSLIIPIFILSYVLIRYYSFDDGFKSVESNQGLTVILFLSILVLWYEFILLLRIFEGFAHNLNILLNIIISIRQFLLFFILVVIAMGHALFILLGFPSYIGLYESSPTYDPFSNILDSILAVYDWSSISFDIWSFWPLTIISVVGSFIFVMILQNVIISFMSDAFSDAVQDSKRGVYRFQIDLIYDFALLEKSLEFNNLDSKFKDKIRVKYICFYNNPNITKSWEETSDKMKSKPYPKIETLKKSGFESWLVEDCEFIWGKEKEVVDDKNIKYWFFD